MAEPLSVALLRWLAGAIRPYLPPPRPGRLAATLIREENSVLVYGVTLPPPGAPDVASREFGVSINGGDPTVTALGPGDPAPEVAAEEGDAVVLSLVDLDDATPPNRSEARTLAFTAHDDLPPPQPGEIGVALLREE